MQKFEGCMKIAATHYKNNVSNINGLRKDGTIYIVKVNDFVKIGFTVSDGLKSRLTNIQCNCPYKIELIYRDNKANLCAEQAIHFAFKNRCVTGEWYRNLFEIRTLIDYAISNGFVKLLNYYA